MNYLVGGWTDGLAKYSLSIFYLFIFILIFYLLIIAAWNVHLAEHYSICVIP